MGHEHITFKMCDYDPFQCPHLSDWVKTLFCGDYEKFLEFLQGLSEKEVKRLISKRESLLNVSAVFHVISGAHRLYSDHPDLLGYQYFCSRNDDVKYDHMKIMIKLISHDQLSWLYWLVMAKLDVRLDTMSRQRNLAGSFYFA